MKRETVIARRRHIIAALHAVLAMIIAATVQADPVEDFYRGKTDQLLYQQDHPAGGGYDLYAHFVARFLGARIPGNPLDPRPQYARRRQPHRSRLHLFRCRARRPVARRLRRGAAAWSKRWAIRPYYSIRRSSIGSAVPDSDNKVVVTWFTSGVKTIEDAKRQEGGDGRFDGDTDPLRRNI